MQVVFDANIYVSALISAHGNPAKLLQKWKDSEIEVVVTHAIIDEVYRVTGYARLQNKYARIRENREELVADLRKIAILVEPTQTLSIVQQDETDNRYIECAVESGANYIITGDPHLLDVGEYQGIKILNPATFLALLDAGFDVYES